MAGNISATFVNVTLTDAFFLGSVWQNTISRLILECTMHLAKAISAPRSQQRSNIHKLVKNTRANSTKWIPIIIYYYR